MTIVSPGPLQPLSSVTVAKGYECPILAPQLHFRRGAATAPALLKHLLLASFPTVFQEEPTSLTWVQILLLLKLSYILDGPSEDTVSMVSLNVVVC